MKAEELIVEREKTHGNWRDQSFCAANIKHCIHTSKNWNSLDAGYREALDAIAVKISRICSGNPDATDHWRDIAGYAQLVIESSDRE